MTALKFASSAGMGGKWYEANREIVIRKKEICLEDFTLYVMDRAQKLLAYYLHAGRRYPSQILIDSFGFAYTN